MMISADGQVFTGSTSVHGFDKYAGCTILVLTKLTGTKLVLKLSRRFERLPPVSK